MDERQLQIVLRARDEASRVLRGVAEETDGLTSLFKNNYKQAGLMAAGVVAGLGAMTVAAVQNAASYEQNRIAFESMLGSADKARSLLAELSDFARKTPFELPEVVAGARQLVAYGFAQKDIIATTKMLGDVSSGLSIPLGDLIYLFGTMRAQGRAYTKDINQFTNRGIPIIDTLVQQLNKSGGMLKQVGGTSTKTKAKMDALNVTLTKQNNRLEEMKNKGNTSSASFKNLGVDIDATKNKIAALGPVTSGYATRVKLTKENVLEMVEDGKIGFEQIEQAFQSMTGKGGQFFNMMETQSHSFSGIMSNINDSFGRFVRQVVGISEQGDIREGSIFYYFKLGAEQLLPIMDALAPKVAAAVEAILKNKEIVIAIAGAIAGLLVLALVALIATFGAALLVMAFFAVLGAAIALMLMKWWEWFNKVKQPIIELFALMQDSMTQLVDTWTQKINEIKTAFQNAVNKLPGIVKVALDAIGGMIANFNPIIKIGLELPNIANAFNDLKSRARSIGIPGFAEGTNYAPGGLALVGERGPELVNLPRGSQVIPNRDIGNQSAGPAIQIAQVVIRQDSDIETLARRLDFYRRTGGGR